MFKSSNKEHNSSNSDKPIWRRLYETFIEKTFYMDYRSIALFRISMSIYLLTDLFWRAQYLTHHYSWWGQYPMSQSSLHMEWRYSFHLFNGSLPYQSALFLLAAVFASMMLIGYRTRLASILSYIMLCSLQNRNIYLLDGSDDYVRVMLFWMIFLPCARCYSVDSIKIQPTSAVSNMNGASSSSPSSTASVSNLIGDSYKHFSLATVGFIVQFTTIYFFTAFLKHGDDWHVTYDAVHYALNLKEFNYGIRDILIQFPEFLRFLTRGTLIFEYVGPLMMVFPIFNTPLRLISILGFIAMHIGFGACLNLYLFIFIPWVCSFGFLPTPFWDFCITKICSNKDRNQLSIFYDSKSKNVEYLLFLYKKFFLIPQTPIVRIGNSASMGVEREEQEHQKQHSDEQDGIFIMEEFIPSSDQLKSKYFSVQFQGETYCDYDAFVVLVSQSWLLWPFEVIVNAPIIEKLLSKFSIFINYLNNSDSEYNLNRYKPKPSTQNSSSSNVGWSKIGRILFTIVIPLIFIVYIPYWNINGCYRQKDSDHPAPVLSKVAYLFKTDQWWGMFAPNPPKYSRWLVMPANFDKYNGIDLLSNELKAADYKADPVYTFHSGQRQRNFLMSVIFHDDLRLHYGRFVCRTWNIYNPDPERGKLKNFKIVAVQRNTRPPYDNTPAEYFKEDIWVHTC